MPEYTILAALACGVVIVAEVAWLRTGVFTMRSYWISMGIIAFFQALVDGWLTKLSAPVVLYDEAFNTGWRAPWDIPVEDWLYGFALVTAVLIGWLVLERRDRGDAPPGGARP